MIDTFPQEEVVMLVKDDVIDVDKLVEDNVVLQVPMQVLTPDEEQKGTMPSGFQNASGFRINRVDPRKIKQKLIHLMLVN